MTKLRIGVLMGGRGIEKEVSFNSGRTICDHLDTYRYEVVPLFEQSNGLLYHLPWHFLHRGKISDFEDRLAAEAQRIIWDDLKRLIDFVYIATHGRFAEDGTLQGLLEVLRIPYLGSKVYASALSMDKSLQKDMLTSCGIAVPRGITITTDILAHYEHNQSALAQIVKEASLTFPLIVKPHKEGSSLGISVVSSYDKLVPALVHAATIYEHARQDVIVEEYIQGMEFTCIIITDKNGNLMPLPPTEIVPEKNTLFFDYEQKYMPGRASKFTPARCTPHALKKIQDTCLHVMKALDMKTIARIDGFLTENEDIIIIDPNTLTGMAPSSFLFRQAAEINLSHTSFINHLIDTELIDYGLTSSETKGSNAMKAIQQKKVGVLLGGRSNEKETSLDTGRNVFYKLSTDAYEPIALFLDDNLELYKINQSLLVRNSTKEICMGLTPEMKLAWADLPKLIDFAFIALHGGEGENGCIQGTLEMLNIAYNGSSVLASALCMDKYKTAQLLNAKGFDTPAQYLLTKKEWEAQKDTILKEVSTKFLTNQTAIVKPHDDGCSVFVSKVSTETELEAAITEVFDHGKNFVLIEEYLHGMELTVGVLGNTEVRSLPPSQAVSKHAVLTLEEKFLPGAGENKTPAPLSEAALLFIKKTIERVYIALNCKGYARIDCFYQDPILSPTGSERLIILEINTLPALTPATCLFHQAAEIGMKPRELIATIIELGFEEHTRRCSVVAQPVHNELVSL